MIQRERALANLRNTVSLKRCGSGTTPSAKRQAFWIPMFTEGKHEAGRGGWEFSHDHRINTTNMLKERSNLCGNKSIVLE
jgi:hypothetical protein